MKKLFFILSFFFPSFFSFSQQAKIDSFRLVLKSSKEDTNRVKAMIALAYQIYSVKPDSTILLCNEALTLAEKINYKRERTIGIAFQNLGIGYHVKGDYDKALENYNKALVFFEIDADKNNLANISNNLGILYYNKGIYDKALPYFFKSLKFNEGLGKKDGIARGYNTIGAIYDSRSEYDTALQYYNKSLKFAEESGMIKEIATACGNIGVIQRKKGNYSEAEKYYLKALQIDEELGNKRAIATACNNIGALYFFMTNSVSTEKENYSKSKDYLFKGLKLFEEIGDKTGIAGSYTSIGQLYSGMYQHHVSLSAIVDAKKYLNKSLEISREIGAIENLRNTYQILSSLDSSDGNFKSSLANYKMYVLYKDSLINEETIKKLTRAEEQNRFDKKEAVTKAEQDNKDALAKQEKELIALKEFWTEVVCIIIFISLISITFFIYKRYKAKQKMSDELALKNSIIEEKNKDITDSINYAKRIQEAMLAPKEIKYKLFPDAFVLFQPRDIVSGDFYWFSEKNGRRLIASVDCTGHGVPGAFMSMIGNSFLNEIVNERGIIQPSEILSELRHSVIRSLKQNDKAGGTNDGMDIALLSFNDENNTVEFAGANNPLWKCRKQNGEWQIEEYKPDKRPIGFFQGKGLPFTNHKIELQKGDTYYIFSDGYADQFGGTSRKKFMTKQLRQLLLSIQQEPMMKQEEILIQTFNQWKGNSEQVDDVLVIGVRV